MKFTLVKGVPERLEEYREVFYGSKLYDAYFAEGDSLNENLLRAPRYFFFTPSRFR